MKPVYYDLFRFNKKEGFINLLLTALRKRDFRWILLFRWYQRGFIHQLARLFLKICTNRTGIEIGWRVKVSSGLVIIHGGKIAVNNEVTIGKNCTIYHGVTIGMEFRCPRRGCPVIGNNVWIGSNACIVGNITVGNDVLIAPLSFVNFDVPDHSIVIGNPGRIIHRENATEGYIINTL